MLEMIKTVLSNVKNDIIKRMMETFDKRLMKVMFGQVVYIQI